MYAFKGLLGSCLVIAILAMMFEALKVLRYILSQRKEEKTANNEESKTKETTDNDMILKK